MSDIGRFCWRELITTNLSDAKSFYSDLFGWTGAVTKMPFGEYTIFKRGEDDVAGMMASMQPDVPSHWLDYITVEDVDASLKQVLALGGKSLSEAMDIPVGRFAVVSDPTGAVFALFRGVTQHEGEVDQAPPASTFCWSHLTSTNLDRAVSFYTEIFGWKAEYQNGMVFLSRDGKVIASAGSPQPGDPSPSNWLKYVAVDDADIAHKQAVALGAKTMVPPTTMEGMGRFAVLADPTGGIVAVWKNLGASA